MQRSTYTGKIAVPIHSDIIVKKTMFSIKHEIQSNDLQYIDYPNFRKTVKLMEKYKILT